MIGQNSVLWMKNLFQKIPNLCYLTVELNNINLDGQEWEKIFKNYLKNIKIFRFKMTVEFSASQDLEEQIDQLLDSFRSSYWIEKHQWFVRCDWCPMDINKTGLLYTLPYAFQTFYYTDGSRFRSTSLNELNSFSYNRVETLHHINRKRDFCENWTDSSSIQFVNIRHLQIKFPFNENFWSVIPTLDRLISIDVTLNQDFGYSQLQILIDRAPRLYSVRFCHLNNFSMNSFTIHSTSIRRLEFFQNSGYRLRYFNAADCAVFAQSCIASQCNILMIDVESRTDILQLIQTMPNLRVLSFRCKYDQNHQHDSLEINDDLIKWLQDHAVAKYTYSIIRNLYGTNHICIWIPEAS